MLIKDGMGSGKHCIGGAHKQEVALIAGGNTNICHKLRFRGHFICSSRGWEVDKSSTAEHTEVVNIGQLPLKHFMGGCASSGKLPEYGCRCGLCERMQIPTKSRGCRLDATYVEVACAPGTIHQQSAHKYAVPSTKCSVDLVIVLYIVGNTCHRSCDLVTRHTLCCI